MAVNVSVRPRRGESQERMIRRFLRKCKKERIVELYRERTDHHVKPSVKRKLKRRKAIREAQKRQRKKEAKFFR